MLPFVLAAETVLGLFKEPLLRILEAHIADRELRAKLAAEIETQLAAVAGRSQELGAGLVAAETDSEHALTWSWRPALMFTFIAFLLVTGLLLPLAEMLAGHAIRFQPRWASLPAGFWELLSVGMGGYIGGRSVEKVAANLFPAGSRTGSRKPRPPLGRADM